MIFSVLMLIFVLIIAYFHWIQGVLSGVISMVLAIVAGTLAIGMGESLATSLLGGKMADSANGAMMCVTFAIVYGVGRILFDSLIPGNVRVPLYFDKVGGLACGAVAGIFCVGTVAVAAQSMPFGPTIVGFARYPIAEEKTVAVAGKNGRQQDATLADVIDIEGDAALPPKEKEQGLILPVDQMVLDFTAMQSRTGALAGGRSFAADHPDLLREVFFGRIGLETGAKHTALNGVGGRTHVKLDALFAPTTLAQTEGEVSAIRVRKLPRTLTADPTKPGKMLLVVRVAIDRNASDTDGKFRFATGSVRLVSNGEEYYPIGTMHYPGNMVLANQVHDLLIADVPAGASPTIDFVFELPREAVAVVGADPRALTGKPGAYVEVKRYARVDLGDQTIQVGPPTPPQTNAVTRRTSLVEEIAKRVSEAGSPAR